METLKRYKPCSKNIKEGVEAHNATPGTIKKLLRRRHLFKPESINLVLPREI